MRLLPLACLLLAFAPAAHAETFNVTRTDDPLPDACAPGDCSLREAMEAAEANDPFAEADEIVLQAGTHTLIRGPLGAIRQALRIRGAGSALTRVESTDEEYRVFVAASDRGIAIEALAIAAPYGLAADTDSVLSLDDIVIVETHITQFGQAATFAQGASVEMRHSELRGGLMCYGEVLIEDSTIFNLYVMTPQEGLPAITLRRTLVDGTLDPDASLASRIVIHAGTLTIEASTIADSGFRLMGPNATEVRGSTLMRTGASLEAGTTSAGTLTIEDSTISGGSIQINNPASTLTMRRVHYIDNTGPVRTEAAAEVTIEDSLFEGNLVRALYAAGGAEWNVNGSSFVDNLVDGNAGGAIVLEDDTVLRIHNSTFAGNSFAIDAAADGARGAAIGYRNGSGAHLILTHVTFVAPEDVPPGAIGSAIGGHGGGTIVDISNSIVRGSCGMNGGVLQNNAGNIESPGDVCNLDPEFNDVGISATDLALGALGDHGGQTPTFLPGEDSRAIDRASTPQCLAVDQRGYARPGGARCDVGSVESDADDTLFADGFDG
jgi:hypothetical protein